MIDLKAICGDVYAKAEGEDFYNVDSFFLNFGGDVDVSYMAFVDGDWSDIDDLVDEEQVVNVKTAEGDFEVVNAADGTPAEKAE